MPPSRTEMCRHMKRPALLIHGILNALEREEKIVCARDSSGRRVARSYSIKTGKWLTERERKLQHLKDAEDLLWKAYETMTPGEIKLSIHGYFMRHDHKRFHKTRADHFTIARERKAYL